MAAAVVGLFALVCAVCAIIGAVAGVATVAMGMYKVSTGRPEGVIDIATGLTGGIFGVASRLFRAGSNAIRGVAQVTKAKPYITSRIHSRIYQLGSSVESAAVAFGVLDIFRGAASYITQRSQQLPTKTYARRMARRVFF